MPARDELLSTLERSSEKAQDTRLATHHSAVEQYGEGERAHRTAYASLKHSLEKVGDQWAEKQEKGPATGRPPDRAPPRGVVGTPPAGWT